MVVDGSGNPAKNPLNSGLGIIVICLECCVRHKIPLPKIPKFLKTFLAKKVQMKSFEKMWRPLAMVAKACIKRFKMLVDRCSVFGCLKFIQWFQSAREEGDH